jgi:hypothetical protein
MNSGGANNARHDNGGNSIYKEAIGDSADLAKAWAMAVHE